MEEEWDIGMCGIRVREEGGGDRRNGEIMERQGSEGGRVQTGIGGRNRGETGIGGREVSEEGKDTRKGGIREEREEECFEEGGRRVFLGILNLVG